MKDSDTTIYCRFVQGDDSALEQLIQAYGNSLVRFANTFLNDLALAEDVMEDSFATLIVKRKPFREQAKFKTYLFRIAKNRCIDLLRSRKRVVYVDEVRTPPLADPEAEALLLSSNKLLYRSLFQLPNSQRQILELVYLEGFSVWEAGEVLKKSRKQTYNLLARAKRNLKEILKKEGFSNEIN